MGITVTMLSMNVPSLVSLEIVNVADAVYLTETRRHILGTALVKR